MDIPEFAISLVTEVWRECNPRVSIMGPPPKTLQIYETADADWKNAHCGRTPIRGWVFDGAIYSELKPPKYPDFSMPPKGMYWTVGLVNFCIDLEHRRAVYSYVLGPRYARGYLRIFTEEEPLILQADSRFLKWLS